MTDKSSPDRQHRENEVAQRRACQAISPRAAHYFGTPEECRVFEAWDGPTSGASISITMSPLYASLRLTKTRNLNKIPVGQTRVECGGWF